MSENFIYSYTFSQLRVVTGYRNSTNRSRNTEANVTKLHPATKIAPMIHFYFIISRAIHSDLSHSN
jgi:hypothetical protein